MYDAVDEKDQMQAVTLQYFIQSGFITEQKTALATFTVVHGDASFTSGFTRYTNETGKILTYFLRCRQK